MVEAHHFAPNGNAAPSENLSAFIRLARDELTAFSNGGAWDSDRWEHSGTVVVFSTKTVPQPRSRTHFIPMADPFRQFAKAYIRYRYSHKPVKELSMIMRALRCIEAGLDSSVGRADICLLTGAVMDVCANKCRDFHRGAEVHYHIGRHMQNIFDFVREMKIVPWLPLWKSPFMKQTILTESIGPAGTAHRESKLPSNATMLMVADLFANADDLESRFFSSILVLLMAAPSRISEVLRLSKDCIQWEMDKQGTRHMYLQWHAAKGMGATKKWVLPVMHEVVQEAVKRLLEIGDPARDAARFAFENPGQFLPHSGCLSCPSDDPDNPLTPDELMAAMAAHNPRSKDPARQRSTWLRKHLNGDLKAYVTNGMPSYRSLAAYVHDTYCSRYWPYIDEERTVLTWNALCVHREHEFNKVASARPFSWRLVTSTDVGARLLPSRNRSLFNRLGMTNQDGTSIKLTTHQIRHWISTVAERSGMDDYTLARWAGRARVADNRNYDHRSAEERLEDASALLHVEESSLLERFRQRQPVTYEELGVHRLGTAKATLYGMCVHDYAMTPCQKQRECMTCKEHVCIKGDHVTLERIRVLEEQTETLLSRAQQAHEDGDFGADRWVDNHKWKLAHVRSLRMMLEHPEVPDGAVIRIPDGHDPSPIRRVLVDMGLEERPQLEAPPPRPLSRALG